MRKSPRAAYCQELNEALANDRAQFADLLLARWTGSDGPALDSDRSWTDILFRAYRNCPSDHKSAWASALSDLLERFPPKRILRLSTEERLQVLGALDLAHGIEWPEEEALRLRSYLAGCLELALGSGFPPPKDLWKEEGVLGQPEHDLLTAFLRAAARHLRWSDFAENHWNLARESSKETELGPLISAGRLWEIARWAIAHNKGGWLAPRLSDLIETLERADNTPGNLTLLFFQTEVERGADRVADLILAILQFFRRGTPPLDPAKRRTLAKNLDYFGPGKVQIRLELCRLRKEPAKALSMRPEIHREVEDFAVEQPAGPYLSPDWSQRRLLKVTG